MEIRGKNSIFSFFLHSKDFSDDNLFILLKKLEDELAELFVVCFRNGWQSRCVYIEAALCILYETNKQRRGLGQDRDMKSHLAMCLPGEYFQIRYSLWE